jgi:hypothetical protein
MSNYNAYDIERYLSNKMNAAEMHAFEQAMMDDPFLADAVDGYRQTTEKINLQAHLDELKERLEEKKRKSGAVIKGSFRQWMSIAAGFIILLSASVVLYRMFHQTEIENTTPVAELIKKDTAAIVQKQTTVDSNTVAVNEHTPVVINPATPVHSYKKEDTVKDPGIITAPANVPAFAETKPAIVKEQPAAGGNVASAQSKMDDAEFKEYETNARKEDKKQYNFTRLNKFSGVVVDENNQPLPFANVTETKSGVGTYADVKGNFTLVSSDTVLHVETKSVGYFSNSLQIRSNQTQRIVLKDESVMVNAPTRERLYEKNKDRPSAMKTEVTEMESEPADGWKNYSIYIVNNLRDDVVPIKREQSTERKEVEVSFDVNPDGTIANLKIERSDCKSCNNEAIRIIKEGPKWKSKTGKRERARFTVQF